MKKKLKTIPSPTNTGIIDEAYLGQLFTNNNPELQAFYEEYFKEITTYTMMKQLPPEQLGKLITDLYQKRKIGKPKEPAVQASEPVQEPVIQAPEPVIQAPEPIAVQAPEPVVQSPDPIDNQPWESVPSKKDKKKKGVVIARKPKTGSGFNAEEELSKNTYILQNKYRIDKRKLDAGILEIRYITNRHLIPIKSRHVSAKFRKFLMTYLATGYFDAKAHYDLIPEEKYLFNAIAKYTGFDLDELESDDSFIKRWDVIIGELEAGNDSKELKKEARKYIVLAQNMGMLSRENANGIIWQYDL